MSKLWSLARSDRPFTAPLLAIGLGKLARYWLSDSQLTDAIADGIIRDLNGSALPNPVAGSCYVLCANRDSATHQRLQQGLILPVVWRGGLLSHDPRLPKALTEVADRAVSVAASILRDDTLFRSYRLAFPECDSWPDLSGLDEHCLDFRSAFGAFLLGLFSLRMGVPPRRDVFVSVQWNDRVEPVGDLATKKAIAERWGAKELHVVGPPDGDPLWQEVEDTPRPELAFRKLFNSSLIDPFRDGEPLELWEDPDSRRLMTEFHRVLQALDDSRAQKFYAERLLPPIARETRRDFLGRYPEVDFSERHLVMVATLNPTLVRIAFEVFRPAKATLLIDEAFEAKQVDGTSLNQFEQVKHQINTYAQETQVGRIRFERIPTETDRLKQFRQRCHDIIEGIRRDGDPIIGEATAGKAWMKLLVVDELRRPEDVIVVCDSKQSGSRNAIGTEQYLVVRGE